MPFCINGLILREMPAGENDKYLNVLTAERGKLFVRANGVRRYRNHYMHACQPMCYDEFILEEKNGKFWLKEAAVIESFYKVREDLEALAVAQYALEVTNEVCVEESEEAAMLKLILNTLYLLTKRQYPVAHIKAVFELRCMVEEGFMPNLERCSVCGCNTADAEFWLDLIGGVMQCRHCMEKMQQEAPFQTDADGYALDRPAAVFRHLPWAVLLAMRYICYADPKRAFAFSLNEQDAAELYGVCENYLIQQLERTFPTLAFYHALPNLPKPATVLPENPPAPFGISE